MREFSENADFKKILRVFGRARRVLLCGHVHPDGDCIGSIAALALILRQQGKTVHGVLADIPETLQSLIPDRFARTAEELTERELAGYDVAVALDCGTPERLTLPEKQFSSVRQTISIDHHSGHKKYAGINWVDPTAPATASMILNMHFSINRRDLTPAVANALFVGLLTDTGRFCNSNINSDLFFDVGMLLDDGADVRGWQRRIYEEHSPAHQRLLGMMLSRLYLSEDGRVAGGYLTWEDQQQAGAVEGDTEGLVTALRSIRGVQACVFVRQLADGTSKASLRSEVLDVAAFCAGYGGGGHLRAAGATSDKNARDFHQELTAALEAALP